MRHYYGGWQEGWFALFLLFQSCVWVRWWNDVRPRIETYVKLTAHLEPVWFRKTKKSLHPPTRRSLKGGRRK